jgi:uncharacterized protein (DUF4415 family)
MSRSIGINDPETDEATGTFEVSQPDYDEMRKLGFEDGEILPVGTHKFRRVSRDRIATEDDLQPGNIKVQITMKVDLDVLDHFKERAAKPNAAPYQTQINAELRDIMDRDIARERSEIDETAKRLLSDDEFIDMLSKRLKEKEAIPT